MDYMNDFYPENGAKTTQRQRNLQVLPYPWHRFFARMTDRAVFSLVTLLIYMVFLGRAPILASGRSERIYVAVSAIVTIICESLMLSLVGTTPGKWLFGIYLSVGYGDKLSFIDAFKRNFKRFIFAEGLFIPILSQIAMYKAYKTCRDGIGMDYDDYTLYEIRKRPLAASIIGVVVNYAAVFALGIVMTIHFMSVPNKGEIDVHQFIENYNYLVDYTYSSDVNRKLDDTLRFTTSVTMAKPYENNYTNFERIGEGEILDGIKLTVRGFNYNYRNFYDFGNEMMFIAMSLADSSFKDKLTMLKSNGFGIGLDSDISFEIADIKAEYDIEMDNFRVGFGDNTRSIIEDKHMFMPIDDEIKSTLEMSFVVNRTGNK